MIKVILPILVFLFCVCFPPAGIIIALILLHKKNIAPVSFPSGRLKSRQNEPAPIKTSEPDDYTTHKQAIKKAMKGMIKPGYNPWSAENRETTLAIHNIIEVNRRKADEEMKEEIRREQEEGRRKDIETLLGEHRTKQANKQSIGVNR